MVFTHLKVPFLSCYIFGAFRSLGAKHNQLRFFSKCIHTGWGDPRISGGGKRLISSSDPRVRVSPKERKERDEGRFTSFSL